MRTDVSGWRVRLDDALIAEHVGSGAWRNQTIGDMARALAARDPRRVTHVFEGRAWTIGELVADADALAGSLRAMGLRPGDVVSFQLPNWVEALVIDLAAAMLGLVVAPIVPIYRDAELAYMLADAGVKAAFVPGEYRGVDYMAMMRRLAPQLPALKLICPVRLAPGERDARGYEALVGAGNQLGSAPAVDPNAVKLILYTSGTTGRPKGVLHSHNSMEYAVRRAIEHWGQGEGDTMLMASPVTHITGYGSGLELPIQSGMRAVFMERWNAAEGVALIEREQATMSMGATPFLQELLAEAARQGKRLPSLRSYACGGAAVPPALIRKSREVLENCKAFRVFGASEVPLTTLGFVGDGQVDLAAETDGEIVHYEVRVVDDDGRDLPPGIEGEICARGPAMMIGYADPLQTAESFDEDGYFRTGDLGHVTPERAIVITGRKKDLINRGGEKISAKEVEDILHRHAAIDEAAVVAMPHERLGETVCAFVTLKAGQALDFERLVAHVGANGVARQKYPERLVVLDALPRTPTGKIRKDRLREDIRARLQAERSAV
ncbi:AMP-binding protein [Pseudoduganella namucuonensis]|uniref:Acyl-CoA synthetase (AMP-forming)/AMP-acid ligase II n=1 Tax=Pseudoduganella namucuonensis TaxID=1035707 RepID=A0A1I7LZX7_9BURK|nr:AMP-binding protein [Pseudoduganella namucuonensis]SFV15239.1 Acyl-CoA synthetase (AMP-forming)/AMP-acid ligase II [Pseudoduganella namucuonensis]